MAGVVPLHNAKFFGAPDFDNQPVYNVINDGVFRNFSYVSYEGNSRTLDNSNLWSMIQMSGNCLITVPASIGASPGDEVMIVNLTGTISVTAATGASILSSELYTIPPKRPARLVCVGTDIWILTGAKTSYTSSAVLNCCNDPRSTLYTFGALTYTSTVYADAYGLDLFSYTGTNADGPVVLVDSNPYTISSGALSYATCSNVFFGTPYTLYTDTTESKTVYSNVSINIFNDLEIINTRFKNTAVSDVLPCDASDPVVGTLYRILDGATLDSPVCFNSAGVVIATAACP